MSMVLTAVDMGQSWMVKWFSLSLAIPAMALAPCGGALVDRHDPRRIWVAGLALPGLCIGAAALQADFWTRLALPAASNAINILSGSAAFASLPALVGPIRIERANSLMAIGPSLAYMVGPTFSDWLFDIVRASLRLGVNAGTAAILAATALVPVLPVARPETTDAVAWSPWGGVRSGWRAIRSAPVVAAAMSLLVLPMVGTQRLARRTTFLIVGGGLCLAVAILAEGLVPIAIVIGAAFVMGGLGNGTHNVGVRNLIFEQTPPGTYRQRLGLLPDACKHLGGDRISHGNRADAVRRPGNGHRRRSLRTGRPGDGHRFPATAQAPRDIRQGAGRHRSVKGTARGTAGRRQWILSVRDTMSPSGPRT